MLTQLGSGGRIEAVHLKQQPIVMRLIALLLVAFFPLQRPLSREPPSEWCMFLSLSPTINIRGSFLSRRLSGMGRILSAICIGAQLTALRRTSRPARIGNLSGQAAVRKMQFWSDAFSRTP